MVKINTKKACNIAVMVLVVLELLFLCLFCVALTQKDSVNNGKVKGFPKGVSAIEYSTTLSKVNETDVAILSVGGEATLGFESVKEAYDLANTSSYLDKEVVITLFADWKASNGVFGTANSIGYGKGGSICPEERTGFLTFDLNGYSIDRNAKDKVDYGEVFCFNEKGSFFITNGYIKGGKTTSYGAGILFVGAGTGKTYVTLSNVHIAGNSADSSGAGIYAIGGGRLILDNVAIYNNSARNYGGGMFIACGDSEIVAKNQLVIKSNKASRDGAMANLVLENSGEFSGKLTNISELGKGSEIYVCSKDRQNIEFTDYITSDLNAKDFASYFISNTKELEVSYTSYTAEQRGVKGFVLSLC